MLLLVERREQADMDYGSAVRRGRAGSSADGF